MKQRQLFEVNHLESVIEIYIIPTSQICNVSIVLEDMFVNREKKKHKEKNIAREKKENIKLRIDFLLLMCFFSPIAS